MTPTLTDPGTWVGHFEASSDSLSLVEDRGKRNNYIYVDEERDHLYSQLELTVVANCDIGRKSEALTARNSADHLHTIESESKHNATLPVAVKGTWRQHGSTSTSMRKHLDFIFKRNLKTEKRDPSDGEKDQSSALQYSGGSQDSQTVIQATKRREMAAFIGDSEFL